jgi:hypothetical protein
MSRAGHAVKLRKSRRNSCVVHTPNPSFPDIRYAVAIAVFSITLAEFARDAAALRIRRIRTRRNDWFAFPQKTKEIVMRKLGLVLVAAALLAFASMAGGMLSGTAQAAPASLSGQLGAIDSLSPIEKSAYIYGGRSHCWYNNGWNGPGWYWCGYRTRRGMGWGGASGWNGWVYGGGGPAVVVVPGPACRWVTQRVVRPNGTVVVRRVRVCR